MLGKEARYDYLLHSYQNWH